MRIIARQFVPFTQLVDGAIKALREHAERVALLHSPHLPFGRNAHWQRDTCHYQATKSRNACIPVFEPYARMAFDTKKRRSIPNLPVVRTRKTSMIRFSL